MSYLRILNLYKDKTILIFKECYALEKIHGTSAHLKWKNKLKTINYFSGSESHEDFKLLFSSEIYDKISNLFPDSDVNVYGEAYGGNQQGMSGTYGNKLKFIAFDVEINGLWLNVPNAENVCEKLGIEFVHYTKISTDLESIDKERDKPSTQAIRNGVVERKIGEGIILRPLFEFRMNNGSRVICKHKRDEFMETKTPRKVDMNQLKLMDDAREIAEEWVTEMRLSHVLDKLPVELKIENTKDVIKAMIEDVYREAEGEIVESKDVVRCIGNRTAMLFHNKIKNLS